MDEDLKLYIPLGVKPEAELFTGFGKKQLFQALIGSLVMGGAAALVWLVHRLDWARSLKISVLFVMSILCLVLYGGSLSFAVFYLPLALINPAVYCFSVGRAE